MIGRDALCVCHSYLRLQSNIRKKSTKKKTRKWANVLALKLAAVIIDASDVLTHREKSEIGMSVREAAWTANRFYFPLFKKCSLTAKCISHENRFFSCLLLFDGRENRVVDATYEFTLTNCANLSAASASSMRWCSLSSCTLYTPAHRYVWCSLSLRKVNANWAHHFAFKFLPNPNVERA